MPDLQERGVRVEQAIGTRDGQRRVLAGLMGHDDRRVLFLSVAFSVNRDTAGIQLSI